MSIKNSSTSTSTSTSTLPSRRDLSKDLTAGKYVATTSNQKTPPTATFNDYLELARFWKPAGTVAFHIPLIMGVMAAVMNEMPDFSLSLPVLVFNIQLIAASILQRSAACAWNDAADYKFDALVLRTKNRPIPRGSITPAAARWYTLALMLAWITTVSIPSSSLAVWTLIPNFLLNAAYPYMKRVTFYPQVFLGFMFSCNILTGYAMTTQVVDTTALAMLMQNSEFPKVMLCLVLSNAAFTIFYDTIYAYQDIADDEKAGVKSTALLWGNNSNGTASILLGLTAAFQVMTLAMAGQGLGAGILYYVITCGGSALLNVVALRSCDLLKPADCGLWFKRLLYWGQIIQATGMVLDYLVRS